MRFSLPIFFLGVFVLFMFVAVLLRAGIVGIALLLVSWGVIFLFLRKFVVLPLRTLQSSLKKIGKGEFEVRLTLAEIEEMREVYEAFNAMGARLQDIKERDEQVSRMKSEFLSITAHQLRTPLSALKWVFRMILDGDTGPLKKAQKELLEKGYASNERMIALVNDLLDVVRIEEGRFDYTFTRGAIVSICEDIVRQTKVIAQKKGVRLSFHKPSRAIPKVALDAIKFQLAAANIIDNAVRYTKEGGRVDVELTVREDTILVAVKDTGVGIPKDQLSRLFTKFFRAENAVRMQTSGSGLGLFIARNIIEKHGGKIWIESEEGKGTTVYFTVPVGGVGKNE